MMLLVGILNLLVCSASAEQPFHRLTVVGQSQGAVMANSETKENERSMASAEEMAEMKRFERLEAGIEGLPRRTPTNDSAELEVSKPKPFSLKNFFWF